MPAKAFTNLFSPSDEDFLLKSTTDDDDDDVEDEGAMGM